jgi:hypothetical protein
MKEDNIKRVLYFSFMLIYVFILMTACLSWLDDGEPVNRSADRIDSLNSAVDYGNKTIIVLNFTLLSPL